MSNGKFSRWMRPYFNKKIGEAYSGYAVRIAQILILFVVCPSTIIYAFAIATLYIDDIITGDDNDNFKRKFKGAVNKLKWKMNLPVMPEGKVAGA